MSLQDALDTMEEKMMKSVEFVHDEFAKVRTGKASTSLVENIQVEVYGTHMRLRELAGISTPEPRLIVIQPWDTTVVQSVVHAIQKSELGINPIVDGKIVRIPIPQLDQERRRELDKVIKHMAEEGRVAIRSERRHGNDAIKKLQKDGKITEDDLKHGEKEIQSKTDEYIKQIDTTLAHKEKEILAV
ncbi:MAG: ribosome recycling factor [Verrucomicrobiota bacterium]|jgi:ribosome recycling factor